MRPLPEDPRLEGLADLFAPRGAPEFVAEAASALFDRPLSAPDADVRYVRYWPGRACVVLWSFPGGRGGPSLVAGKLFAGDRGARSIERSAFVRLAQHAGETWRGSGPPFRFLPERNLLLNAFPLDGRLGGLPEADSEDWIRRTLAPAVGIEPGTIDRVERDPVSFKPWRRCVFRYRLHGAGGSRGFFAKVFRDDRGVGLAARVTSLARALEAAGASWSTPPAVRAYLARERILVFDELAGAREARDLLHDADLDPAARGRFLEVFEAAGAAIRELQGLEVPELRPIDPGRMLEHVRKRTPGIEEVEPELAEVLARELDRLGAAARSLEPEPAAPAHGALRLDQLLILDEGVHVLDFDAIGLAGRSADAGHFLGFLDMIAVRRPRYAKLLAAGEEAFLRGLGSAVSPDWLRWHRDLARVKKTARSFLSLDRKWREALVPFRDGPAQGTLPRVQRERARP